MRDAWDGLFSQTPHRAFYNDWRWHAAIARHLIGDGLYYLEILDGARPVAIVPLQAFTRTESGVAIRYLSHPTHPHLTLFDVLVDWQYLDAPVLESAVRWLQRHAHLRWHRLRLSHFTSRSNLHALCRAEAAVILGIGRCYYAAGPALGASAKQIRNARRLKARARERFGTVETAFVRDRDALCGAVDDFMRAEASGWKGEKGTAVSFDPRVAAFYRELMAAFAATGQARVAVLRFGGDVAAAHLLITSDDTAYVLKIAYDSRYNGAGAGSILLADLLEHGAGRFAELNLLTAPAWADRWHFNSEPVCSAGWYNATATGAALGYMKRLSDSFLRRRGRQPSERR